MNLQIFNNLQNVSLLQLLTQQIRNQGNCNFYVLCINKCRQAFPNQQIISAIIQLMKTQGQKWQQCLNRLSINNYDLTFDLSINHIQCYKALLHQISLGKQYHFDILQQKIQNLLIYYKNLNQNYSYIWEIYIQYLQIWGKRFQNRLQKVLLLINQRLSKTQQVYQHMPIHLLPKFLNLVTLILLKLQKKTIRNLSIQSLLKSIQNLDKYLSLKFQYVLQLLTNHQRINFIYFTQNNNNKKQYIQIQMNSTNHFSKDDIQFVEQSLQCFISASKSACFYSFFYRNVNNFTNFLFRTPIIRNNSKNCNYQQLMNLQDSLIYRQNGDDIEFYMQQLLNSLCFNIDSFSVIYIDLYLLESRGLNFNIKNVSQLEDMILKLCIIHQNLYERYDLHKKIQQIVQNLLQYVQNLNQNDYKDFLLIKIVKMMHLFNNILPHQNFKKFHLIGFNIISKNLFQIDQEITCQITKIPCQIFFIAILEEELKFNKKNKQKFKKDFYFKQMHQNCLWICQQLIKIIQRFPGNNRLYQIFYNLIRQFQSQISRQGEFIISFLINQLQYNFQNMLKNNKKTSPQILRILDSLQNMLLNLDQDAYLQIQEKLMPFFCVLQQPQKIDFQDAVLKIIPILMKKAQCITPNLSYILTYTRQVFVKNKCILNVLNDIIKELCQEFLIKSVFESGYQSLIVFFGSIIDEYLQNILINHDYHDIFQTQWKQCSYIMQNFIQNYQQLVKTNQIFISIHKNISFLPKGQEKFQLLLTFNHICPKIFAMPNDDYSLYPTKLRYTVNLTEIMFVDNFLFNNQQYERCIQNIQNLINFQRRVKTNNYELFNKSQLDYLPFGKIKVSDYIQEGLRELKNRGVIDKMQYVQVVQNFRN